MARGEHPSCDVIRATAAALVLQATCVLEVLMAGYKIT